MAADATGEVGRMISYIGLPYSRGPNEKGPVLTGRRISYEIPISLDPGPTIGNRWNLEGIATSAIFVGEGGKFIPPRQTQLRVTLKLNGVPVWIGSDRPWAEAEEGEEEQEKWIAYFFEQFTNPIPVEHNDSLTLLIDVFPVGAYLTPLYVAANADWSGAPEPGAITYTAEKVGSG
jgi:hypothetical protein